MPASLTPSQSQFVAWFLSRRMNEDSVDMLVTTPEQRNPQQVNAALLAFQRPLPKGVILAGEVGFPHDVTHADFLLKAV